MHDFWHEVGNGRKTLAEGEGVLIRMSEAKFEVNIISIRIGNFRLNRQCYCDIPKVCQSLLKIRSNHAIHH